MGAHVEHGSDDVTGQRPADFLLAAERAEPRRYRRDQLDPITQNSDQVVVIARRPGGQESLDRASRRLRVRCHSHESPVLIELLTVYS
jgi:hypothetical protein